MEESNLFQRQFENDMLATGDSIKQPDLKLVPPPPSPLRRMMPKKVERDPRDTILAKGVLHRWKEFINTRKEEPSSGSDISSDMELEVLRVLPEPLEPIDLDELEEPEQLKAAPVEENKSNIPEEDEENGLHA